MRYQIWNQSDDIYTPSGEHFTAEQWAARHSWVRIPGEKMIITTGLINGGAAMEFNSTAAAYQSQGAEITDDMSDEEVLAAIEAFEDNPPENSEASTEERIAAALEAQVMLAEQETATADLSESAEAATFSARASTTADPSPALERVRRNFKRGLWSAAMVQTAMNRGYITAAEAETILGA